MSPSAPIRLAFLFPLVHRPLRQSFAAQFEQLSEEKYSGHVFVLSSARHEDAAIGRFALHAGPGGMDGLRDLAAWARQQIALPLRKIRRRGVDVIDMPSRYRQSSWLSGLLGPTFSLMEDTQGFGTALANGDLDRAMEKGKRLLPFSNLFYLDALWRRANGTD